jgi:eukaryotic-like serine/threonine-protein kinase
MLPARVSAAKVFSALCGGRRTIAAYAGRWSESSEHRVVDTGGKLECVSTFARGDVGVQTDQVEVMEPPWGARPEDPQPVSRESHPMNHGEASDPMIGQLVLSRYRVVKPLAHGGMGVVYLGRTEGAAGFSRPVVIKRVLPELLTDPNIGKMFVREARILSNLNHAGIVGVVDFGQEDGAYVMVLDYVHGFDANQWLTYLRRKERRVPFDVALQIAIRVLEALHYAHTLKRADGTQTQVVHRDISPSNILLDAEGNVRLLDFGIARIANAANEYRTQETTFKGKLGYAHPSLIARGEPSAQTDVYSAAVVLFQLLTGSNPFRGTNPADTLTKVIRAPLPKLRDSVPEAPEELERVLLRGMSRDLSEGFASAAEMAEALRRIRSGTETGVNDEMSRLFTADFFGEMPRLLGIEPLDERDAAWRNDTLEVKPGALRSTPPRDRDSDEPTRIRRTSSDDHTLAIPSTTQTDVEPSNVPRVKSRSADPSTTIPPSARPSPWPWIVLSLALSLGVVWVATNAFNDTDGIGPTVTGTQPTPATASALSGAVRGLNAEDHSGEAALAASVARAAATASGPSKPDLAVLTQSFVEQSAGLSRCFDELPEATTNTLGLQLSLSVNTAGIPTAAHVIPGSLDKSKFGACVLGIANGARFGALTDAVTFRVPLRRHTTPN